MKDKTVSTAIEELLGLNPKMYSLLVDDSSKHNKAKSVNKNVACKNKNVLLNNKCFIHSMNKIQSKNHKIVTCEINKYSLSYFHVKIHTLNNRYNGLALDY